MCNSEEPHFCFYFKGIIYKCIVLEGWLLFGFWSIYGPKFFNFYLNPLGKKKNDHDDDDVHLLFSLDLAVCGLTSKTEFDTERKAFWYDSRRPESYDWGFGGNSKKWVPRDIENILQPF